MKTIEIDRATEPLSTYANGLGKDILVLTDHKKPVAAVVSLEGVDEESLSLCGNPEFMEIIRHSRGEFKQGNTLTLEEMKKEFKEN